MSYFQLYKSKTSSVMEGALERDAEFHSAEPADSSREYKLTSNQPPKEPKTFVSSVSIRLNSDKNEDSTLPSSTANQVPGNAQKQAVNYSTEASYRALASESVVRSQHSSSSSSSISRKESSVVSRKTTTMTATKITKVKSSSVLQSQAISRSQRETGAESLESGGSFNSSIGKVSSMSMESSSTFQSSSSRSASSSMSVESRSALSARIDAKLKSRSEQNVLASSARRSESKVAANSQVSSLYESSLVSESSTATSFTSKQETRHNSRFSSLMSRESKQLDYSSASRNELGTDYAAEPALSGVGGTGDKSWYYELLQRLENLRWNYQNLEAEYAFLEKLMAEQKQDLKKAQSWARSMRKHVSAVEDSRVALD